MFTLITISLIYSGTFLTSSYVGNNEFRTFIVSPCIFVHLGFSPTYALIYIIKILSQAVTLIAHLTPTCFDPHGSKHVGVKCAIKVTACDNILIIYMSA